MLSKVHGPQGGTGPQSRHLAPCFLKRLTKSLCLLHPSEHTGTKAKNSAMREPYQPPPPKRLQAGQWLPPSGFSRLLGLSLAGDKSPPGDVFRTTGAPAPSRLQGAPRWITSWVLQTTAPFCVSNFHVFPLTQPYHTHTPPPEAAVTHCVPTGQGQPSASSPSLAGFSKRNPDA